MRIIIRICFKAFLKESDTQFLKIFPDNHPDIADFFQKPEELILILDVN